MADLGGVPASSTIYLPFTTHAAAGGSIAPLTGFEAADVKLYKNGSANERTSQSGWTMTSPFDGIVGMHVLAIDLSDNSDAGFYAAGASYFAVLTPDTETIDNQTALGVIGTFRIVVAEATAGVPKADVNDKTGFSLTSAYDPAKTAAQAGDAMALTSGERSTLAGVIWDRLLTAITTVGSIGKLIKDNLDAAVSSRLATVGYTAPDNADITAIKAKTDNLPSDPADESAVEAAITAAQTAVQADIAALNDLSLADIGTMVVEGAETLLENLRLMRAALVGKASGLDTNTPKFRDAGDTKDRIAATTDASGNRTSVAVDGA